jgi:hypothetical protein
MSSTGSKKGVFFCATRGLPAVSVQVGETGRPLQGNPTPLLSIAMQRSFSGLLLRGLGLPQRCLALALPRLPTPGFRRGGASSLHVFARQGSAAEYTKVQVGDGADADDLKRAVVAELELGVPPARVRLLREAEGGGALVPLDGRRPLAGQGVLEGASVVVEVLREWPP